MTSPVIVAPVTGKADLKAFVELAYQLNRDDPAWVPPLRSDVYELLNPAKNPFYDHADVQLFLARRDGRVTGRISAHIDRLALTQPPEQGMGPGTGNWGMMEAEDEASLHALIDAAEGWLHGRSMNRVLAPISLSIWDEPGLLTFGHDHSPTVMMGHHAPQYQSWIENRGYRSVKELKTFDLEVQHGFPPIVQRIVQSGERNARIKVRKVDKSRFKQEAALILDILNDAWAGNWGFVPITDREIDYVGKRLKPIVHEELIRIAEVDGEPMAFMMTLPDLNEAIKPLNGHLFPFGWAKLLLWLRKPRAATMRVPLMGVRRALQGGRMASQLAFMLIEAIRRDAVEKFSTTRAEIGWVLDDNAGMNAIADAIDSKVNRIYTVYEKQL